MIHNTHPKRWNVIHLLIEQIELCKIQYLMKLNEQLTLDSKKILNCTKYLCFVHVHFI